MPLIELPLLSTDQMREVEWLLIEAYQFDWCQLMENAGRNLALLAKQMLDNDIIDRPLVVLAGREAWWRWFGGGAPFAQLGACGAQILLTHEPEQSTGVSAQQLAILQAMGAPLAWAEEGWELPPTDLVIDAIIGYDDEGDQSGEPQGKARALIQLANSSVAPILSLDAPSGLDTTTGQLYTPHIRAAATLTLALPKIGLLTEPGRAATGQLYLADISVPPQLYARLGLDVPPLFARDPIVPIDVVDGKAVISGQ